MLGVRKFEALSIFIDVIYNHRFRRIKIGSEVLEACRDKILDNALVDTYVHKFNCVLKYEL